MTSKEGKEVPHPSKREGLVRCTHERPGHFSIRGNCLVVAVSLVGLLEKKCGACNQLMP